MRRFFILTMSLLVAVQATAQIAPPAPAAQPNIALQAQQLLGGKNRQQSLGQAVVVATLLGCVQKKAGQPAMQSLFRELQTVGQTASAYCKQNKPTEARQLILTTIDAKHNDPVVRDAVQCYREQQNALNAMGGSDTGAKLLAYSNWIQDPALARSELQPADVCKPNKGTSL